MLQNSLFIQTVYIYIISPIGVISFCYKKKAAEIECDNEKIKLLSNIDNDLRLKLIEKSNKIKECQSLREYNNDIEQLLKQKTDLECDLYTTV